MNDFSFSHLQDTPNFFIEYKNFDMEDNKFFKVVEIVAFVEFDEVTGLMIHILFKKKKKNNTALLSFHKNDVFLDRDLLERALYHNIPCKKHLAKWIKTINNQLKDIFKESVVHSKYFIKIKFGYWGKYHETMEDKFL